MNTTTLQNGDLALAADKTALALAVDLDNGSGGNIDGDNLAILEVSGLAWTTTTNIVPNYTVAEIYATQAVDGTNFPSVDLTAGASTIASLHRVGELVASTTPTSGNPIRVVSNVFALPMGKNRLYLKNVSTQQWSANATVKLRSWAG